MIKLEFNPSPKILRQFAVALLVVAAFFWRNQTVCLALAFVGLAGVVFPRAMKYPFVLASIITFPLGLIISFVMLFLFFFGLLTPVALAMRWFGRDALRIRKEAGAKTFWVVRTPPESLEYYLHQ